MTNVASINLNQFKERVMALSMAGKYGEAVKIVNDALAGKILFMSSGDNDLSDFITGWLCGEACCSCSDNGCCGVYCVGLAACVLCCGGDTASACCGCNLMGDICSDCVYSG